MQKLKLTIGMLALLSCLFTACDFGTYSARVEERLAELENPNTDDGYEEGEERVPDTKLFHAAFIDFYTKKGRAPSGWPEMLQYCNSFGAQGRKFYVACENFQKNGLEGNWKLAKSLDQTALNKEVILYKADKRPRVFGNGQSVDF